MTCEGHQGAVGPGSLVLRSPAYAHVISGAPDSVCDHCLDSPNIWDNVAPVKLYRCSGCRQSYYCNVACQKAAWARHKMECKYLKRIAPKVPPAIVKLILRVCLKNKLDPDYSETLPDGSIRTFSDLKSHKDEISGSSQRSEAFSTYLQVIKACVGDMFPVSDLFLTFCRIVINSTEITDAMGGVIGTGLYLGLSAVDHSCIPNVNVVFNKDRVELRAMTDIPAPFWSNVRVSYLNLALPTRMRKQRLQADYYFTCDCTLCSKTETEDFCRESNEALSDIFNKDLDDMELVKAYGKVKTEFHVCDYRMVDFCEKVIEACLNIGDFELFLNVGQHMLKAYKHYYSLNSLSFGLHLAKLAKVSIYLNKIEEALQYWKESLRIMKMSHGENSLMVSYLYNLRDTISL